MLSNLNVDLATLTLLSKTFDASGEIKMEAGKYNKVVYLLKRSDKR